MKLLTLGKLMSGMLVAAVYASAATPTIGVATTLGSLTVDSATVNGNANLSNGSQINTDKSSGQILLQNGTNLTLATNSGATVYKDHMMLTNGGVRVDRMSNYSVNASGFRVEPEVPGSNAIVRYDAGTIQVAALSGAVKVFNSQGAMLTRVGSGTAAAFKPQQSGGSSASTGAAAPGKVFWLEVASVAAAFTAAGLAGAALAQSGNGGAPSSP